MPLVTIRTAADLTGKDRTTLNRAIASGKLSATKSELGHYLIDPAELERVYGTLHIPAHVHSDEPHAEDAHPTPTPSPSSSPARCSSGNAPSTSASAANGRMSAPSFAACS